jgi:ribosomal protein S18 acetylase RimI-like enzyme
MHPITSRLATLNDLPTIAALFNAYRQFYEQPADLALATQFIGDRMRRSESVILLAGNDQHDALGFCQLYPMFCSVEAKPVFALYDLFVQPSARQLGVGKLLLQAAAQHAQQSGFARMDLTTAKTNYAAQSLYEAAGWVREEVFLAYSKAIPR